MGRQRKGSDRGTVEKWRSRRRRHSELSHFKERTEMMRRRRDEGMDGGGDMVSRVISRREQR